MRDWDAYTIELRARQGNSIATENSLSQQTWTEPEVPISQREGILGCDIVGQVVEYPEYFYVAIEWVKVRRIYVSTEQFYYDAPILGGLLTTRQPAEYLWMSGNPTPLH